jgi:hypothetical protein
MVYHRFEQVKLIQAGECPVLIEYRERGSRVVDIRMESYAKIKEGFQEWLT